MILHSGGGTQSKFSLDLLALLFPKGLLDALLLLDELNMLVIFNLDEDNELFPPEDFLLLKKLGEEVLEDFFENEEDNDELFELFFSEVEEGASAASFGGGGEEDEGCLEEFDFKAL